MNGQFSIKYRFHWCGPCEQFEDTKEETIINSDGKITIRHFDHHGVNGHYRLVRRAEGIAETDIVKKLYADLFKVLEHRQEYSAKIVDADAEIVLAEPGLKISADAFLTDGKNDCSRLIDDFMSHIDLQWKAVID